MSARPYYKKDKVSRDTYLRYGLAIGVLFIPLCVVMFVFSPFAERKARKEMEAQYDRYRLAQGFSYHDFQAVVKKMTEDYEFKFYFYALSSEQALKVEKAAYEILYQNHSRDNLLSRIQEQKMKVGSIGELFLNLTLPPDFSKTPEMFPELNSVMWEFFEEEFKLAILGAIYKSNFNRDFIFIWDDAAQQAAEKLRKIILVLKTSKK